MSNAVISPFIKTYPVFEPNQVLSHNHLNDLRIYLDSEDRLTRNQLIGTGIVNGLELEATTEEIQVSLGVGITTDGYIIATGDDQQRFTHVKPYQFLDSNTPLKAQMETLFHVPVPEGDEATALGKVALEALVLENANRVRYFELLPEGSVEEGMNTLAQVLNPLKDAGVALYLETKDNDITSCFTTSCDERGIKRDQKVRPLLIVTDQNIVERPEFQRPLLAALPRLRFEHSNAPNLAEAYARACDDTFISSLENGVRMIDRFLRSAIKEPVEGIPAMARDLSTLKSRMVNSHPQYLPYFYEFLRDRKEVLIEMLDEASEMDMGLYPPTTDTSPEHLMLGPINSKSNSFKRSVFFPARPDNSPDETRERITFLWKRLHALSGAFDPEPSGVLKITPSHGQDYLLEEQSIPYYYNVPESDELPAYWNYDLYLQELSHRAPGYYNATYNGTVENQYKYPLEYDHEEQSTILVEGIIGQQKSIALDSLRQLKEQHHLAFGLIALRISDSDHDDAYHLLTTPDPVVIEDNFKSFIKEHPGLYHARGIQKDWSLALVFKAEPDDTDGPIVAVMALPYICCGKTEVVPPAPFVLDAIEETVAAVVNDATTIDALLNDSFDRDSPIEVDLVEEYVLDAIDDALAVTTSGSTDIHAIENDQFDPNEPLEVDLVQDLAANDDKVETKANEAVEIHVIDNDTTSPGDVALDFDEQS